MSGDEKLVHLCIETKEGNHGNDTGTDFVFQTHVLLENLKGKINDNGMHTILMALL